MYGYVHLSGDQKTPINFLVMYLKVELNIGERMIVLSILPKEGSIVTVRLIRELISKLGASAQDFTEYGMEQKDGAITFNEKGTHPVPFELADSEMEIIRKSLKELDSNNKLIPDMISIWEKFC